MAKQSPQTYGEVKVKDYKITINGNKYGLEDLHYLPPELQPEAVYTPRSSKAVVFFTKNSPLSNHYYAPFQLEGKEFSCIEQYLAFTKAKMAQQPNLAKRAMEQKDPAEHKIILNILRKDVQERWTEQAPDVILPAVRAKFLQNEQLANFLVETHPLPIGEASRDTVWGIGLTLESTDVLP